MKNFKSFISEEEKKSGKEIKSGKNSVKINPDSESLKEAEIQPPAERLKTDRNMYNIPADEREAAKQRLLAKAKAAREKRMNNEAKWYDPMEDPDFDPKEAEKKRGVSGKNNPKKGKPVKIEEGDYWHPDPKKDRTLSNRGAKLRAREDGKTSTAVGDDSNRLRPGESYMDYARRKGGSMTVKKKPSGVRNKLKSVLGLKNSYEFEEDMVEEGMTLKDFKANRRKLKRRESSADAKKRGHVGKEWYNSGRTYSSDEAKRSRAKMDDEERRTRHRSAVDPDNEDDNNYSADRTKNPKKIRKQKAVGEITKEEIAYDSQEEVSKESNQGFKKEETALLTFSDHIVEKARNAYAIGTASAMKLTGDEPPLEKSTIKKAHKIAKSILKKEEVEVIDELNRAEKETGINTKTGKPTQTGGAKDDKAFTMVKRSIRNMEGTPAGQRKKEKGKKPPTAGSYGAPASPAQKVAQRRAAAKRSQDNMSSRFD